MHVFLCVCVHEHVCVYVYIHVDVKGRIAELFVLLLHVDPQGDTRVTLSDRCLYSLNHVIGPTNDTLKSLGKNLPALSCHPLPLPQLASISQASSLVFLAEIFSGASRNAHSQAPPQAHSRHAS